MTDPKPRSFPRSALLALAFCLISAFAWAGGSRDVESAETGDRDPAVSAEASPPGTAVFTEGERVDLTGRVKAKGNEPFSFPALVTEDGMFKLVGPKAEELLREHQLEIVRIRGTVAAAGSPPMPPEIEVRRYRPAG